MLLRKCDVLVSSCYNMAVVLQRVVIMFVHFHWSDGTADATFDCAALLTL